MTTAAATHLQHCAPRQAATFNFVPVEWAPSYNGLMANKLINNSAARRYVALCTDSIDRMPAICNAKVRFALQHTSIRYRFCCRPISRPIQTYEDTAKLVKTRCPLDIQRFFFSECHRQVEQSESRRCRFRQCECLQEQLRSDQLNNKDRLLQRPSGPPSLMSSSALTFGAGAATHGALGLPGTLLPDCRTFIGVYRPYTIHGSNPLSTTSIRSLSLHQTLDLSFTSHTRHESHDCD